MRRSRTSKGRGGRATVVLIVVLMAAGLGLFYSIGAFSSQHPLVVYCAHDAVYADEILKRFERETGIPVAIRYDTEATKSLGLVQLLIQEKPNPRCDVFWNNQVLGTVQLQEEGVLLPYRGSGYDRIPSQFKDPDGHWVGFAARMRVYIVNTDSMPATDTAILDKLSGDLSRVAIAKPLYGTTLSHYTVLWDRWGPERLKAWHKSCRERGIQEFAGNATVKNVVAQGVCDLGYTDNDDFYVAKDAGEPVKMLPIRLEDQSTICIPNSVAIIQGTEQLAAAQRLVDFLASAETELALARSTSRQIPIGPIDEADIPQDVKLLRTWSEQAIDLNGLGPARAACLAWLKSEYVP